MSLFSPISAADLDAWRDPAAEVLDIEPTDPGEHHCMYHDSMSTPVAAKVISHWQPGYACRPCADTIAGYLRGGSLQDSASPEAIRTAAALSIGMERALGDPGRIATVTELRSPPRRGRRS